MASNYSNFFFSARTVEFSFDEYVYGRNTYTGSAVATGTNDPWSPSLSSTTVVGKSVVFDNYVFSPKHYGHMRDTLYSPPLRYPYIVGGTPGGGEPTVETPLTPVSSTHTLSVNTDGYSRISKRYVDGIASNPISSTSFTEIS